MTKRGIHILIAIAGVCSVWAFFAQEYYSFYASRTPQPELGLTVPIAIDHGHTAYISAKEDRVIAYVNAGTITILSISLACMIFWPMKRKSGHDG